MGVGWSQSGGVHNNPKWNSRVTPKISKHTHTPTHTHTHIYTVPTKSESTLWKFDKFSSHFSRKRGRTTKFNQGRGVIVDLAVGVEFPLVFQWFLYLSVKNDDYFKNGTSKSESTFWGTEHLTPWISCLLPYLRKMNSCKVKSTSHWLKICKKYFNGTKI